MTQQEWPISRFTGRCASTGRVLGEGEEFFSAIVPDGEEFRRMDYSVAEWVGPPEGALGYFRARVPMKSKPKKPLVDEANLFEFFERLRDETDAARVRFRFVLALMLVRKRTLRFESSERTEQGEFWVLRAPRDNSTHRVANPELTDEEAQQASQQLAVLLGTADAVDASSSADTRRATDAPIGESLQIGGVNEPN